MYPFCYKAYVSTKSKAYVHLFDNLIPMIDEVKVLLQLYQGVYEAALSRKGDITFKYHENTPGVTRYSSIIWERVTVKTEKGETSFDLKEVDTIDHLLKFKYFVPLQEFLSEQFERMHIKVTQCTNLLEDVDEEEQTEEVIMPTPRYSLRYTRRHHEEQQPQQQKEERKKTAETALQAIKQS